jgi:hypothetical protein
MSIRFAALVAALVLTSCHDAVAPDGSFLAPFTTAAARTTRLAFTAQPQTTAAGAVMPPVRVSVTDSPDARIVLRITRGSNESDAVLLGTVSKRAVNGVATFTDLRIAVPQAGYKLRARSPDIGFTVSAPFDITAPSSDQTPALLAIVTQPSGAETGKPFAIQPVVQLRDANNLVVPWAADPVTAEILSGTGTLAGTVTVTPVNGVATFANLAISGTGTHTLRFRSGALAPATSNSFNVTGVTAVLHSITFDRYGSTAELRNDCVTFNCVEQDNVNLIDLDETVAAPGSTKSMRYRYRHAGSGCNSITIRRAFKFAQVQQEVWAEFKVRFSTNFTTANSACAPNDHKLIFGDTKGDQSSRWAFYVGADSPPRHTLMVQRPEPTPGAVYPNQRNAPSAEALWQSGTWHTVRLHIKHSTTMTSGDGIWEVWLDGVLIHRETGFNTNNAAGSFERLMGFSFAHNKDDGPPDVDMFLWWGPITVYRANPGW